MPNRRVFDLIVLTAILLHPVVKMVKLDLRRHAVESPGSPIGVAGMAANL